MAPCFVSGGRPDITASFHAVFDHVRIEEISGYEGPAEIIAFGKELTAGTLRNTFRAFTSKARINKV